ncbi:hypothetical protein F5884DRAFT_639533, partial [Xylogone sp. PMI_703]
AIRLLEAEFPWGLLVNMLNSLLAASDGPCRLGSNTFPEQSNGTPKLLPDDYTLRGLFCLEGYFPKDWFTAEPIDRCEKTHELPFVNDYRLERRVWIGIRIADGGNRLEYDHKNPRFTVPG